MLGMCAGHLGCMAAGAGPWCFARLPFSFDIALTGCIALHVKRVIQQWRMQLHCRMYTRWNCKLAYLVSLARLPAVLYMCCLKGWLHACP